jgi:hypothetical protein
MSTQLNEQIAKDLDAMLSLLLVNTDVAYDSDAFKTELFKDYDTQDIEGLMDYLLGYDKKVVSKPGNMPYIQAGSSTKFFLNNGGFTKIYNDTHEAKQEEKDMQKLIRQEVSLSIDKLINENLDYLATKRRTNNNWKLTIILAIVSIVSLIVSIKSCQVTKSAEPHTAIVPGGR